MSKKCRFLVLALAISSILTVNGCSKSLDNTVEKSATVSTNNGEEEIVNNVINVDNAEEIVAPGYEDVDSYLYEESEIKGFQGVALIAEGDEIKFAKAYGYADADEGIKNTLETRFAIASNTKQFTAAAIMKLFEEGKLNIDDTIDKYFPKFQYGSKITIRELLQMRSGLVDYLNEPQLYFKDEESLKILDEYKDKAYFDEYVSDPRWNATIILNNLYLNELKFEPGQAYDYCNTNYYLLGLIIEQASGMSYEDYIQKNIFDVCHMENTSMTADDSDAKGHGSAVSGEIVVNPKFTFAAGNIYSNVYDLLKWKRMLQNGNIVSEESYNQMITPVDDSDYGFGLIVRDGTIRHSGVIDGFNSYTEYDPNKDITIILLENCDATTAVLDAKYDGAIIRSLIN